MYKGIRTTSYQLIIGLSLLLLVGSINNISEMEYLSKAWNSTEEKDPNTAITKRKNA